MIYNFKEEFDYPEVWQAASEVWGCKPDQLKWKGVRQKASIREARNIVIALTREFAHASHADISTMTGYGSANISKVIDRHLWLMESGAQDGKRYRENYKAIKKKLEEILQSKEVLV